MTRVRVRVAAIVVMVSSVAALAVAQTVETGFLNRPVSIDGVAFRYQVYVPATFNRTATWPVILALHGGGEYGDDGLRQTQGGIASAIRQHQERFPVIVVIPQAKADGTPGWQGTGGRAAIAALDQAAAEFNGDRSRLYLTGLSAGGNGAWYLGSQNPDKFAAMVVVCGWISARAGTTSGVSYPALAPFGTADPFATIAGRVSKVPIWIFHGDADRLVSVEESRKMAAALKALSADVQYTELPVVDHNAWDPAYAREDLWAWLFRQRRR